MDNDVKNMTRNYYVYLNDTLNDTLNELRLDLGYGSEIHKNYDLKLLGKIEAYEEIINLITEDHINGFTGRFEEDNIDEKN